jgi:hypothetical protein
MTCEFCDHTLWLIVGAVLFGVLVGMWAASSNDDEMGMY